MIAVLSTSSPLTSIAVFDGERLVRSAQSDVLPASSTLIQLLQSLEIAPELVTKWVADVGPGSFTGVRIAVTMAKTLAYAFSTPCGAIPAPLLMASGRVAIPSRKLEWLLFEPGCAPVLVRELPPETVAYGHGVEAPVFPLAERALPYLSSLADVEPAKLVPMYLLEPSISTPKKAYGVPR